MNRNIKVCYSIFSSGFLKEMYNYSIDKQVFILDKVTKIHENNLNQIAQFSASKTVSINVILPKLKILSRLFLKIQRTEREKQN